ncbi:nuclear transport factor 2 family protein [Nocardia sp. NPDC051570]|uniref:nuclear transport factor 2 family protein n=1 Tax=Nocardia sp. NPDC051570 TaxID=3364324 RepID=UPI0037974E00
MSVTTSIISAALTDLLFDRSIDVETAVARHFADDYRQRTDGVWADRAEFVEHITHLRGVVESGSVEVHDELSDGDRYADRHTVHARKNDGSEVAFEVLVFAEMTADGRFRQIIETTTMLSGGQEDRNLGSAR